MSSSRWTAFISYLSNQSVIRPCLTWALVAAQSVTLGGRGTLLSSSQTACWSHRTKVVAGGIFPDRIENPRGRDSAAELY